MDEGTTAIAEELVTPAIQTQAPETEDEDNNDLENLPEAGDDADDGSDDEVEGTEGEEGSEPEPELLEVEFNGKKHKIPAELKDSLLMHADYTRKTQEVAELRKTVEARQAEAEQQFNVSQDVLQARAALMLHEQQLEQFHNTNWQQLEAEDPIGAMSAWRQFQQLKEERAQIAGYLNEQHMTRNAQAEQETANRLRETREFAEKNIPGWTPEIDTKIANFAISELGQTVDTLKKAYSPNVYKTLHLAWLGHQALQKREAISKPTSQVKPLTTVSSKANPSARKPIGEMSMEEYAAHRKAQMAKAGR